MGKMKDKQKEVCKTTGSEVIYPSPDDIAGVAIHTAKESPIYGVREDPENGSSGWYIWAGEYSDAADFFKPLHIEHIKDFFPHVEKYLALSPNHKFIVDRNGYEDVWIENE